MPIRPQPALCVEALKRRSAPGELVFDHTRGAQIERSYLHYGLSRGDLPCQFELGYLSL
jgi:hypothetical protein